MTSLFHKKSVIAVGLVVFLAFLLVVFTFHKQVNKTELIAEVDTLYADGYRSDYIGLMDFSIPVQEFMALYPPTKAVQAKVLDIDYNTYQKNPVGEGFSPLTIKVTDSIENAKVGDNLTYLENSYFFNFEVREKDNTLIKTEKHFHGAIPFRLGMGAEVILVLSEWEREHSAPYSMVFPVVGDKALLNQEVLKYGGYDTFFDTSLVEYTTTENFPEYLKNQFDQDRELAVIDTQTLKKAIADYFN